MTLAKHFAKEAIFGGLDIYLNLKRFFS